MGAVGSDRERDVEPAVDVDLGCAAGVKGSADSSVRKLVRPGEQGGAGELSVADLQPVRAVREGRLDRRRQRVPARGAVDDQAQDGRRSAQKLASPSSGLDAEAYRRRGMRPAS